MTYLERLKISQEYIAKILASLLVCVLCICSNAQARIVDTSKAVIHHSDSGDVSAEEIDRWHKANTYYDKRTKTMKHWSGIGYHYVIRSNGDIEEGRNIKKKGAHAPKRGRNWWVGIVLTGRDTFTDKQISSLKRLLAKLKVQTVERHHEECPGQGIDVESLL